MNRLKLGLCFVWGALALLAYSFACLPDLSVSASNSLETNKTQQPTGKKVSFEKEIKPIFEASCNQCHTGAKAKGGLRLDMKAAALKGGASGPAIVAGKSKESELIHRVTTKDSTLRMPPSGNPLTTEQIALLSAWIDEGAEWPEERVSTRAGGAHARKDAAVTKVDFVKDVQPILKASCYGCHAGGSPKGQLRLDSRTLAMKGGISGPVIIAGDSEQSRLVHRILGHGGERRMPLGGEPLKSAQIAIIKAWIDQGAVWPDSVAGDAKLEKHWAYVKPVRPQPPQVKDAAWVRNPIDNFILARLEKEGLKPSPEAQKETLIRRVYLDLIGLPPSVKEVDEFLADASQDAYEKVVDKLLSSPHYGERWARPWLDLARYADTNGYEKDRRRSIWKYRDWVIDALNKDMPFDQFTIEQLAGDLLPDATVEQQIATGFNRNTMQNEEGGVDQQEALYETLIDRVNTTSTVWLGSTVACAQCHNHKYDPITQKDFFQLYAFFNNTDYTIRGDASISEDKLTETILELPTAEQEAKRKEIEAELDQIKEKLKTQTPELDQEQAAWEKDVLSARDQWTVLEPVKLSSTVGSTLTKREDRAILVSGDNPEKDTYIIEAKTNLKGITGVRLEALPDESLPRGGPGRDIYGNFALHGFEVEIAHVADGAKAEKIKFSDAVADEARGRMNVKNLLKAGPLKEEESGWAIDATRDETRLPRQAVFVAEKPFGFDGETLIRIKLEHNSQDIAQSLGAFRLSLTTAENPKTIAEATAKLRPILEIQADKRTEKQKERLAEFYRSIAPSLKQARERQAELQKSLQKLGIVSTLVMKDRPTNEPLWTNLRIRGSFTSKGERVLAGVPAALHPFPKEKPLNRLGLAHWLVDENNPLTSRVTVNRFWEQFFGRGIVETSEDFGTQGERPSHPELLDWLATEFIAQKWSMKRLHRLIVTSATYRQSSKATSALLERDPYNKLLARGPRFRVEGEMIRDIALTASGLLSRKIGGPSVFPYQPDGIWSLPFNDDRWTESEGEDLYRRGLYTFWRRTSPYPTFVNFDATSREFCTVRRVRTNTPLQALSLMNDAAFFEMAQALARRMVKEAGPDVRERLIYGFRLCLARRPSEKEVDELLALYKQQLDGFTKDSEAAKKIAGSIDNDSPVVEIAALTIVSNVLLNLDETMSKE